VFLVIGLASTKPMHIDETANWYFARQIAEKPLDPYGFEVFWYQHPEPANQVLTPPVMVYWWSIAIRLLGPFGGEPMVWKLWLLPFVLILVFSLHALFCRFANKLAMPLTWMTMLSPAFLPSLNLMPDLPELAWGLSAIVVFLWAGDRNSPGLAVAAGVCAGLAMQTKYTGFLVPAVMLLRSFLIRRPAFGVIAVGIAVTLFCSWECFIARRYGESHFLYQVRVSDSSLEQKSLLAAPVLSILGAVAPHVGLLALVGLGWRRAWVVAYGLTAAFVYLTAGLTDVEESIQALLYGLIGGVVLALCICNAAILLRRHPSVDVRFLILWLVLELGGYFALTPFPAVRRVLGLVLVLTLLAGRLASERSSSIRLIHGIAVGTAALGLLFFAVDWCDARAEQLGVELAAECICGEGGGRVWYVGHWGVQFYAERAGMNPVVPDASLLPQGDWLVVPGPPVECQDIVISNSSSEPVFEVTVSDPLPWRTVMGYYGGYVPLAHRSNPRLTVSVRRVTADWVPQTPTEDP
jgi:hypothetical protein